MASRAGTPVRRPQQVEEEDGGGRFRPLCGGCLYDWRGFTPLVTLHKEVKLLQEHRPSGPWRGCPRGWLSPGVESFSKTKGVAGLIGFLACRVTDCEAGRDYFPGRGCNGVRR